MIPKKILDDLADLDTYMVVAGRGDVHHVVCPSCDAKFDPASLRGLGLYHCGKCGKPFVVAKMPTPMGDAWVTRQHNPPPHNGGC